MIFTESRTFGGLSNGSEKPKSAVLNVYAVFSLVVTVLFVPAGASLTALTVIVKVSVGDVFVPPPLSCTTTLNVELPDLLAAGLASELQAEPQAYAKIIEGDAARKNGDPRQAIKVLIEANGLLDTWIGHFVLGRAYLDAGQFAQADGDFDRCIKRRGEVLALFLDEEPTYERHGEPTPGLVL